MCPNQIWTLYHLSASMDSYKKSKPFSTPGDSPKFEKSPRNHRRKKWNNRSGNNLTQTTLDQFFSSCRNLPFEVHNKVNRGWKGGYHLNDPHNVPCRISPKQIEAIQTIANLVNLTSLPDLLNHSSNTPKVLKAAHSAPS